ncbi:MAG TPA: chromate efflux transporter [Spirochaetia bacterium]|nr:chromate efflux transporter [Spirochaetia bacterium]
MGTPLEVLRVAARLGVTSFGGPIAHLGYFHDEYVVRRRWIDEQSYADLVALCQMIPGPASSQLGMAIGIQRAGFLGGIAAWAGFTLPSAIAMTAFALVVRGAAFPTGGWLHGLMLVAVAVVAQAVWSMARTLASDAPRASIAFAAAIASVLVPTAFTQILLIIGGAIAGLVVLGSAEGDLTVHPTGFGSINRVTAVCCLAVFAALLVGLPVLRSLVASQWVAVIDSFYRSGSLVFGGGHVVLPLLQREVVPPGWITNAAFMAGYGAAQAVPGPLFSFAAYLGAALASPPNGVLGAAVALTAIYLPSFLLVIGLLPFYGLLRSRRAIRSALSGVNAAVVGILLAALYRPVWTSAILRPADFALGLAAFLLLVFWKVRPWIIVVGGAIAGEALSRLVPG